MGENTEKEFENLRELFKPHIESFDYLIDEGLEKILVNIKPVEVVNESTGQTLRIWFDNHKLLFPEKGAKGVRDKIYPYECRQAKESYSGELKISVCFQYDKGHVQRHDMYFGDVPIMLMSKRCNLRKANPAKLVSHKEEATEMGGYFILKGLERLMRIIIMQKRNFPLNVERNSFREKQDGYTDKAVVIRCVRVDMSALTLRLYYLQNGSARLGFWLDGREFLLPVGVILKALIDTNDHEIYVSLTCCHNEVHQKGKGVVGTQLVGERVKIILDEVRSLSLLTQQQCLHYLGESFRPVMGGLETESGSIIGDTVLRDYVFIHLENNHDKFNLLIFMLQKLFAFVDQTVAPDNTDALQNHEVLLPGHLITLYLKDRLQQWLKKGKQLLEEELRRKSPSFDFGIVEMVKKVMNKYPSKSVGSAIENLLIIGTLQSQSGLDLPQRKGFTIQAERLNFLRFVSHFRSVHRGAAFAGLRSTSVRKLLPESWGFLCPVHTPDGEPCGLLNHLTSTCRITSYYDSNGTVKDFLKIRKSIVSVLTGIGMIPSLPKLVRAGPPEVVFVLLDGCVVGSISSNIVEKAVEHIRRLKLSPYSGIPDDLEIGYVPLTMGGAYPGLYLFTSPSRFVRPVRNISIPSEENQNIELIGPFEQVYMEIRCADGGEGGRKNNFPATHEEIHPTGMLSVVANLTPWSDHNQSPRNMYQCQMAKQTMGFSSQAIKFRADQKLYHLQTPQNPIVRTESYSKYHVEEFPNGTNAIVAVLAYTGYDMEDAMILNKSSVERGMCRGQIYQVETVDLKEDGKEKEGPRVFDRSRLDNSLNHMIDRDGFPHVGQVLKPKDPYCSIRNTTTDKFEFKRVKGSGEEPVYVDYVAIDVNDSKKDPHKVNIRFRHPRNPIIGDKFSSRHGQKGVCSQLWPDIDMPFSSVTGMRPDLIINPHAFPSRMTIGMLLESIAAKGGSLNGKFVDATPFASSTKVKDGKSEKSSSLIDELGSQLVAKGFQYHGLEVMYSGFLGTEMACEIFIGPVYYQRLRHMVSDKFQVRSTGIVDQITRQPIKGRKRGGGIRFGEMERDSMLAHGAAYLLHDRLHTCSDHHIADVCSLCGSLLTTTSAQTHKRIVREQGEKLPPGRIPKKVTCHACKTSKGMETVAMPYVFRYLAAELAAMNIKMTLKLTNGA
ncbi:DNA-directed RNA polymerase I subunit 2-like [Papaver somniferum]|uniref:DNA-directed RNA polymerase I subunit 2-like n=1 Tax=Papaver somniferum TaxID=3469 RepID=UPI000E6F61F8|nr:DNA-directed RNA polymerase I subunit 2-like [Papaver somniferum]